MSRSGGRQGARTSSRLPRKPIWRALFCCLDVQNRVLVTGGQPGIFSRFALTNGLAEFRTRRDPPAVAPIRNIASTPGAFALHRTKGVFLEDGVQFSLAPKAALAIGRAAAQALAVESIVAACARDQEAVWANRQVEELARVEWPMCRIAGIEPFATSSRTEPAKIISRRSRCKGTSGHN